MKEVSSSLIPEINNSLDITLAPSLTYEELQIQLTVVINNLINHDFEKLIFYLYRIDVHEDRMRQLLEQHEGENAASLIADLIIERQLQKIKSRREFTQRENDIEEDEKW